MLADRFSRKTGLAVATVFFCVGAVIQTASHSYWITYGTRGIAGEWASRLPFLLQMAPALMVGIGIQFFPYSPRWLAMRHRDEDSLRSLERLRRLPGTDERVQLEWKGILRSARRSSRSSYCTVSMVLTPTLSRLSLNSGQLSGINAFVYYAPIFFAALGQSYEMSLILSGMVNVCQFVAGIPTFLFLDKMGRRKLAIFGGIAMGVPHIIMAGIVSKYNGKWENDPGIGWFGLALIYLYVLAHASSYGPLAWTLPAEVFPSSKRAKGVGAATAMVWLANFIIGVVVPEMQLKLGWGTYLFFGCFCFAASVFSFFFVPETAGKSLEQIAGTRSASWKHRAPMGTENT
ncbi:hypothetical protein FJTKL_05098 [Diaporthe vaccinii]|uniref:Major facilitator superfamily (MFS) profile domain-containing protein n=1 Tax=Diaporthe vaccinii TaxID=105482 RepID=A0ABR4EZ92_9PEZI